MDRKALKQAGKGLLKKNYWYSVVVAFFMTFTGIGGSTKLSLPSNTNTSQSASSSFDSLFGNGEYTKTFFEEFFLFDKNFLEDLMQRPIAIVFFATLISAIIVGSVLGYLIFNSFRCGGIRYFLKSRKNQPAEIKEVFQNLRDKTNFNIARVTFSRNISILLWSFVFIIPGIIKSYEYFAIDYILAVRPDIDKNEAKRLSKILMDGNKADLFVLGLSFIGWNILTAFTFGLLNIFYVNPYMQATYVEFFSDIRLQALANGKITPNDIPDYEFIDPQMQYQQAFYQQPKNIVYRPDGMPINNVNYNQHPVTPPTYQQTWNNPYAPQGIPTENNFYTPQQPIVEPVTEPTAQPIEPVDQTEEQETDSQ